MSRIKQQYNSVIISAAAVSERNRAYFAGLDANVIAMHTRPGARLNIIQDMQTQIADLYDALQQAREMVEDANKEKAKAEAHLNHAFDELAVNGMPRERARTVANGIDVLVTRMRHESGDGTYKP